MVSPTVQLFLMPLRPSHLQGFKWGTLTCQTPCSGTVIISGRFFSTFFCLIIHFASSISTSPSDSNSRVSFSKQIFPDHPHPTRSDPFLTCAHHSLRLSQGMIDACFPSYTLHSIWPWTTSLLLIIYSILLVSMGHLVNANKYESNKRNCVK